MNGPSMTTNQIDPLIEKCNVTWEGSEIAKIIVNSTQLDAIQGRGGTRLNEIRQISQAQIQTHKESDSFLSTIKISKGPASSDVSILNAIWIMDICLNAYRLIFLTIY